MYGSQIDNIHGIRSSERFPRSPSLSEEENSTDSETCSVSIVEKKLPMPSKSDHIDYSILPLPELGTGPESPQTIRQNYFLRSSASLESSKDQLRSPALFKPDNKIIKRRYSEKFDEDHMYKCAPGLQIRKYELSDNESSTSHVEDTLKLINSPINASVSTGFLGDSEGDGCFSPNSIKAAPVPKTAVKNSEAALRFFSVPDSPDKSQSGDFECVDNAFDRWKYKLTLWPTWEPLSDSGLMSDEQRSVDDVGGHVDDDQFESSVSGGSKLIKSYIHNGVNAFAAKKSEKTIEKLEFSPADTIVIDIDQIISSTTNNTRTEDGGMIPINPMSASLALKRRLSLDGKLDDIVEGNSDTMQINCLWKEKNEDQFVCESPDVLNATLANGSHLRLRHSISIPMVRNHSKLSQMISSESNLALNTKCESEIRNDMGANYLNGGNFEDEDSDTIISGHKDETDCINSLSPDQFNFRHVDDDLTENSNPKTSQLDGKVNLSRFNFNDSREIREKLKNSSHNTSHSDDTEKLNKEILNNPTDNYQNNLNNSLKSNKLAKRSIPSINIDCCTTNKISSKNLKKVPATIIPYGGSSPHLWDASDEDLVDRAAIVTTPFEQQSNKCERRTKQKSIDREVFNDKSEKKLSPPLVSDETKFEKNRIKTTKKVMIHPLNDHSPLNGPIDRPPTPAARTSNPIVNFDSIQGPVSILSDSLESINLYEHNARSNFDSQSIKSSGLPDPTREIKNSPVAEKLTPQRFDIDRENHQSAVNNVEEQYNSKLNDKKAHVGPIYPSEHSVTRQMATLRLQCRRLNGSLDDGLDEVLEKSTDSDFSSSLESLNLKDYFFADNQNGLPAFCNDENTSSNNSFIIDLERGPDFDNKSAASSSMNNIHTIQKSTENSNKLGKYVHKRSRCLSNQRYDKLEKITSRSLVSCRRSALRNQNTNALENFEPTLFDNKHEPTFTSLVADVSRRRSNYSSVTSFDEQSGGKPIEIKPRDTVATSMLPSYDQHDDFKYISRSIGDKSSGRLTFETSCDELDLNKCAFILECLITRSNPALAGHLTALDVKTVEFSEKWYQTCFSDILTTPLQNQLRHRIDIMGPNELHRCSLLTLNQLFNKIMSLTTREDILQILCNLRWEDDDDEAVVLTSEASFITNDQSDTFRLEASVEKWDLLMDQSDIPDPETIHGWIKTYSAWEMHTEVDINMENLMVAIREHDSAICELESCFKSMADIMFQREQENIDLLEGENHIRVLLGEIHSLRRRVQLLESLQNCPFCDAKL